MRIDKPGETEEVFQAPPETIPRMQERIKYFEERIEQHHTAIGVAIKFLSDQQKYLEDCHNRIKGLQREIAKRSTSTPSGD